MNWLMLAVLGPPAVYGVASAIEDWRAYLRRQRARRRHPSAAEARLQAHIPLPRDGRTRWEWDQ